ncbi:MAG: ABC transporter permease, partial [Planctomycetota bacterium]
EQVQATLELSLLAVGLALTLGFLSAWCVTRCDFPGRRLCSVLLCMPFAIPSYLLAGLAVSASYHPAVPSPEHVWGAGLILGLTLYPWVYVPAKAAFITQSRHYDEIAVSLGMSPWQRFWRVHCWLLLPTAAVGALLVFMAVLNDYGTAQLLGVKTLSVGIHDAMFSMYRRDWAAQLALIGLALPILAVLVFSLLNARRAAYQPSNRGGAAPPQRISGLGRVAVYLFLGGLLLCSLVAPLGLLLRWAIAYLDRFPLDEMPGQIWDSLSVTLAVTAITLLLAILLSILLRRRGDLRPWRRVSVLLNLNYAVPGIMLGIALLFASAEMPGWLNTALLSNSVGLLVTGGCLAYLCFPFFSLQAGQASVSPDMDDLCRVLGIGGWRRLWRIDLPLLSRFIACGGLLVIVNMAKELPLSLTLQPFGHLSLSMRLFTFAGVGMLEESAIYSLALIILVTYPIVALDRMIMRQAHAAA